jgi:hypothetical protein
MEHAPIMTGADTPMTDGYLPLAAFRHLEPTALGVIDLDSPPAFVHAPWASHASTCRDALAFVRLHGPPLGVVHLNCPPPCRPSEHLAETILAQMGPAIAGHVTNHPCASVPDDPAALLAGLPPLTGGCGAAATEDPPESVAVIIPTIGWEDERRLESLAGIGDATWR